MRHYLWCEKESLISNTIPTIDDMDAQVIDMLTLQGSARWQAVWQRPSSMHA